MHAADPEGQVAPSRPAAVHAHAVSDAKLGLEKINEFGLGQGKIPTVSFRHHDRKSPTCCKASAPTSSRAIMTIVANWGSKGHEALIAELKAKYNEPWMTQNVISTYGDMWLMKARAGKSRQGRPAGRRAGVSGPWMAARRNIIRAAS